MDQPSCILQIDSVAERRSCPSAPESASPFATFSIKEGYGGARNWARVQVKLYLFTVKESTQPYASFLLRVREICIETSQMAEAYGVVHLAQSWKQRVNLRENGHRTKTFAA